MWAYADDDDDGDRSSRLTPPEGAPFQDARGEVELGHEALVVEVEGLPAGDYKVCLADGTGTLTDVGTIQVAAREDDGDDDDDDGDGEDGEDNDDGDEGENGEDGDNGDDGAVEPSGEGADDGDDDDGEGDDDDDDDTDGSLRLSGDTLPFGATSPLELAGRAIAVKDSAGVVLLQGMTPAPIAEEPEDRSGRCELARPDPAPDADAEGVLILEQGDGRIVIKVRVSNLTPETVYDIIFTDLANMSETIGMITTDDDGDGKFKLDTDKGDSVPFGAADLAALEGFGVKVEAPDDAVVLTGTVCAAEVEDGDDDDDDGGDGEDDDGEEGDDDDGEDGDDDDDDDGEDGDGDDGDDDDDEECEVDLARAETSPDPDAEGEAEIEGQTVEVEVEKLAAGTYEVFLIDPAPGGAAVSIGSITTVDDGEAELEFEVAAGDPLPLGFIVEVRAAGGEVVLRGTLPAVACEAEDGDDDGEGEEDGDDDGDDDDDDGSDGDDDDGEENGDGEEPPVDGAAAGAGGVVAPAGEVLFVLEGQFDAPFLRGDSNRDGEINITDPLNVLQFLFSGGSRPYCLDASDSNDDGEVNISDPIALLGYLFLGTSRPGAPGTMIPGSDPSVDRLYCEETTP